MQISEAGGVPEGGSEPCRFPKLEECAHFHYEKVQLPGMAVTLHTNMDRSLHSQHNSADDDDEYYTLKVTSGDECWLLQRSVENFRMFDAQLHQCIYDRKISHLPDLSTPEGNILTAGADVETILNIYLEKFCTVANNSLNCGPVLNWLQMDNKGHRLLVPSEESRSINTPAVAAAYSIRRYVSQARDELDLEVGDMISVIDMASPGESIWWRGKRGFKVGFFPQHCVHIIGDKVPRNMPLPPPVVGSLALSPIKPVLRKHGKLIAFFRSFILNRPSRRRLKQSGILKERVFGCDLGEHLLNSGNDVPMVLKCCSEFIEKNGIVDGIYRLSGVTSNIQKLRNTFDEDRIPNLYTEEIVQDIHSVASLLKMYFRELPNPLCTYQLYQSFVNAVQGCNPATRNSDNDHERLLKMREAVQKLPPPHYRTLEYLMRHLAKVAKHGSRTGMTTRNVAIVWAPNLLRSEELEGGGVAALQGVGVQAVVTEFLICYTDLIFCDRLPPSVISESQLCSINSIVSSPKRNRPKSLAISTPTKLITLEEARSKHQLNRGDDCGYIEVGGGPKNLPKKYHTVLELPAGRKRYSSGWRSFFSKNRNNSQNTLPKARKASTPGIITAEKSITDSVISDARRKLRTVKSAESLTSGISESATNNEMDSLGPLHSLQKAPGHNRSVSHDSYFDLLQQSSQNNSEGSLLDLSEIQLNFDLEESEMRIFSEDESLVSSPRMQKEGGYRKYLMRARQEEFNSAGNSTNPSPKKQARVVMSPDSMSRKRTRLEDQLSDIQYIDCNTPESNPCTISITAQVHQELRNNPTEDRNSDLYTPKNKSPRNSQAENKRQSLNLEQQTRKTSIPKSLTDVNITHKVGVNQSGSFTPQSPIYKPLNDSSNASTPGDYSPVNDVFYQKLKGTCFDEMKRQDPVIYENFTPNQPTNITPKSPTYENVLTTISITYKSPAKRFSTTTPTQSPTSTTTESIYEDMTVNIEKASVPIEPLAVLPTQEANQPLIEDEETLNLPQTEQRPKSLSALEDLKSKDNGNMKSNLSTSAVCNSKSEVRSLSSNNETLCKSSETTVNSSVSSDFVNTNSSVSNNYQFIENLEMSPSDLSLSEVVHSSSENLSNNQYSCPVTPTQASLSPNVSPTQNNQELTLSKASDVSLNDDRQNYDVVNFNEAENRMDKRKSSETIDENAIYQQVKYFRRSVHEINALLDLGAEKSESTENFNSIELDSLENDVHIYENVEPKTDDTEMRNEKHDEKLEDSSSISSEKLTNKDAEMPEEKIEENSSDVEMLQNREYVFNEEVINEVADDICDKVNVRSLTKNFEVKEETTTTPIFKRKEIELIVKQKPPIPEKSEEKVHSRRNYDKDSIPPCIRLRNLKHAIKTRSLDEDEFNKEFREDGQAFRRKSLDENLGYVNNPKTLNPPKRLPENEEKLDIHLSHSIESKIGVLTAQNLNRERIEKYKEERRRILHEKYRSESFKEDKDVLMSQLKIKPREDAQRKRSESESAKVFDENDEKSEKSEKTSLKLLAAKFESPVSEVKIGRRSVPEKFSPKTEEFDVRDGAEEALRNRWRNDDVAKSGRRRHTFDARERELDAEKARRISVETTKSPRKERTSPSLCIKDMKAIFESKSQQ